MNWFDQDKQFKETFSVSSKTDKENNEMGYVYDVVTLIWYFQYRGEKNPLMTPDYDLDLSAEEYRSVEGAALYRIFSLLNSYERIYKNAIEKTELFKNLFFGINYTLSEGNEVFQVFSVEELFSPYYLNKTESEIDELYYNFASVLYYDSEKNENEYVLYNFGKYLESKAQPVWFNELAIVISEVLN